MATYTYQVEHGEESPAVGYGEIVNGGKLTAVNFDAQLTKNQIANDIIDNFFDTCEVDDELRDILLKIQGLI